MNIAVRTALTVPEFLAWADSQSETPHAELINGQIVMMAFERIQHVEVKLTTAIALRAAVERSGVPCHALGERA